MTKHLWSLFVTVTILAHFGCNRLPERPAGMPDLVPCTVCVTFGGQKLEGVGVVFEPKDTAAKPWPGGGKTDAEGRAVLKTAAYYNGIVPGEYIVQFQKYAEPEMGTDGMPLPAKPLVPLRYGPGRSKETVVVTPEQAEYVFELESL